MCFMQARFFCSLADSAALARDPRSVNGQQFQCTMGYAMPLMAVFLEYHSKDFIESQSMNMLDGASRMPFQSFSRIVVRVLSPYIHVLRPSCLFNLRYCLPGCYRAMSANLPMCCGNHMQSEPCDCVESMTLLLRSLQSSAAICDSLSGS